MEQIKLNIEAIRAVIGVSRSEMAELMNINTDRYNRLASNESKMLATELIRLHHISGVPYDNIYVPD